MHDNNLFISRFESFIFTLETDLILRRFFFHWPAKSIIALSHTNKRIYFLVQLVQQHQWNPDKFLLTWIPSPALFREQLSDCNAIVAGLAAIHFFERRYDPMTPLDIYLNYEKLHIMSRYLRRVGYVYHPTMYIDDSFDEAVNRFLRQVRSRLHTIPLTPWTDAVLNNSNVFHFTRIHNRWRRAI